jgi:hypothetical protein
MTNPTIAPEGFPDLFVFTLIDALQTHCPSVDRIYSRPLNSNDPTRSVGVVEGEGRPSEYEIAGRLDPSMLDWDVAIQLFVKAANEIDGRNIRRRMMREVRKALFLPSTTTALMTLNDDIERVTKFRLRTLDFSAVEARDANKQFFLLGQIALSFTTERKES